MMMRVVLFLATNMAILFMFNIVANLFGIPASLHNSSGINFSSLLLFSFIVGMGGSFFSLAISKWMAKRSMGVQIIEQPQNEAERWLVGVVEQQAKQLNIGMPEVGIFPSRAMNAFATGWNRNSALVAVSVGLLEGMNRDEVEAVLGHEMAHVANGDMVTMGLLQGVMNTFVVFFARIIAHAVAYGRNGDGRGSYAIYFIVSMVADLVLGLLASFITAAFSRYREYRADAGGANLAGNQKMINALKRLQQGVEQPEMAGEFAAFGINRGAMGGLGKLMSTHPPLEERIARLEQQR